MQKMQVTLKGLSSSEASVLPVARPAGACQSEMGQAVVISN